MQYSDEALVLEIRKNNQDALRVLYKTHYPMVLNMVMINSGTQQEAKDIYQETVIAFYEKVQSQSFALTCQIKTFLYAVSRRLWLKRLAGKKIYIVRTNHEDTFSGIDDDMLQIEKKETDFRIMDQSLSGLGEPCKTILEDFYLRALDMDAICEKFGYTNTDNAKNQKYKCLQRLKKLFFSAYKENDV